MPEYQANNAYVRVSGEQEPLIAPEQIKSELPLDAEGARRVSAARASIKNAILGRDSRLLVIVGPCSIHDPDAAIEYARRLADLSVQLGDRLLLVMRTYFQKQRTSLGWKGLIEDPRLEGASDINQGLRLARRILLEINRIGVPCATEFVDAVVPKFIEDFICWSAIGARTAESQIHRELASALPMPVGIKNSSDGDWRNAINGMLSAHGPHSTFSLSDAGRAVIVHSKGNPEAHIVLRGGKSGPNFSQETITQVRRELDRFGLARPIVVDCSHGNSSKNYRAQPDVFQSVLHQVVHGSNGVLGMMLESNLKEGAQQWGPHSKLSYGVSITDSCIGWETTEALLRRAHECLGGIGGGITREQRRAEAIALEKEALAEPANWIPSEVAK